MADDREVHAQAASAPVPAPLDGPGVGVADPRELLLGYLDWYRDAIQGRDNPQTRAAAQTALQP